MSRTTLLLSDDMGYGDIGFNGCPDIRTPNLDALLTGRYPTQTGVYNVVSQKASAWPLLVLCGASLGAAHLKLTKS